jgi:hypothetical protein
MTRISHALQLPAPISLDIWRVDEPIVNQRESSYPEVQFQAGDTVQIINADGCRQTGRRGAAWKRWVNPSGPNSDALYHSLIKVPDMVGFARVQEVGNQFIKVPDDVQGDFSLHLGYEDDGYSDNGYSDHDNGTENQCSSSVNAFIELPFYHRGSIATPRSPTLERNILDVTVPTIVNEPGSWDTMIL